MVTETVRPTDTAGDLLGRLAESGAGLLVATLDGIEDGSLEAQEQPADGVSFAPKILVEDAEVDWTEPAVAVDRRVRAPHPGPGAWSTYAGERIKIGPVSVADDREHLEPGVLEVTKNAVYVGTATAPCGSARSRRSARSRCRPRTGRAGCASPRARRSVADPRRRAGTAAAARARAAVVGPRGARAREAARRPGVPGPRATSTRPARSRSRC